MNKAIQLISTITITSLLFACGGGSGGSNFDSNTSSGSNVENSNTGANSNGGSNSGTTTGNTPQTHNVRLKKTTIHSSQGEVFLYSYEYDSNNRIKRLTLDINEPEEKYVYDYTYDNNNDLIKMALTGEDGTHFEYDNHQLIKRYSKYSNGRIASVTEATEWDDNYLPTLIKSASYESDGSLKTSRVKHNTFTNKELTRTEEILTVNLNSGGVATTTTVTDITNDQSHVEHLLNLTGSSLLDFRPKNAAPFTHHPLKRTITITDSDGTQVHEVNYNNTYNNLGNPTKQVIRVRIGNVVQSEEIIEHVYEDVN